MSSLQLHRLTSLGSDDVRFPLLVVNRQLVRDTEASALALSSKRQPLRINLRLDLSMTVATSRHHVGFTYLHEEKAHLNLHNPSTRCCGLTAGSKSEVQRRVNDNDNDHSPSLLPETKR